CHFKTSFKSIRRFSIIPKFKGEKKKLKELWLFQFNADGKVMSQCWYSTHSRFRFSLSSSSDRLLGVISQPSCVAKCATLLACLMPDGGPQDVDQVTVATGRRVLRLPSLN